MSVKTTPAQHQSNLRNVYGTFAIEGMTISKDTRRNLDRMDRSSTSALPVPSISTLWTSTATIRKRITRWL